MSFLGLEKYNYATNTDKIHNASEFIEPEDILGYVLEYRLEIY